jgi:hypothetical protein
MISGTSYGLRNGQVLIGLVGPNGAAHFSVTVRGGHPSPGLNGNGALASSPRRLRRFDDLLDLFVASQFTDFLVVR